MTQLQVGDQAPDFSLPDHKGEGFHLADRIQSGNVLLVFNLGLI